MSVMLYSCMFPVALSMNLFVLCVACLTVFVNCLVKQFTIYLGVFFVVQCDGVVKCGRRFSMYDLPKNVFVVPVVPVSV